MGINARERHGVFRCGAFANSVVLLGNTGEHRARRPVQRVRLTGAQAVSLRPVPQGAAGLDVGLVSRRCPDGRQKAAPAVRGANSPAPFARYRSAPPRNLRNG
jgi:hypothetical protein